MPAKTHRVLLCEAVHRPAAQGLVGARVGLGKPRVKLQLEVEVVGEPSPRLEVSLDIALQPLDHALGLRVSGLTEPPVDLQLPTERCQAVRRATRTSMQAPLAVEH